MKIHVFSDLHLDTGGWQPPDCGADVYVVAGDLFDDGACAVRWCKALASSRQKPVFFVPGNHEFQGAAYAKRLWEMHRQCRNSGVFLMHNRSVLYKGVYFVGTPLWTDFAAMGAPMAGLAQQAARDFMADYSCIFYREPTGHSRLLRPSDTVRMHQRALRALYRGLEPAYEAPVVVITHHAPSLRSVGEKYAQSMLNAAFASDLDLLVGHSNAPLWVHGHMHDTADYLLGATRVVCNPRGTGRAPNLAFDEALIIEVLP